MEIEFNQKLGYRIFTSRKLQGIKRGMHAKKLAIKIGHIHYTILKAKESLLRRLVQKIQRRKVLFSDNPNFTKLCIDFVEI